MKTHSKLELVCIVIFLMSRSSPYSSVVITAHIEQSDRPLCQLGSDGGGGEVDQAYSRLSTTHGHITVCKLDSVMYAGVGVVI